MARGHQKNKILFFRRHLMSLVPLLTVVISFSFLDFSFASGVLNMNVAFRQRNVEWSWTGGTITPTGSFTTNVGVASAASDGLFNKPVHTIVNGTSIYVVEETNHRISKFNLSGVFQGWIGNISNQPTGGAAGCKAAPKSTVTPGWCTGGSSKSGSGGGMMNQPKNVQVYGGFLYVADMTNHRIQKFDETTGAFVGWIGRINASPTGGDAGCAGAATDSVTLGWCTGGTSKSGTGDGMMSSPTALAIDGAGNLLYVADKGNNRIQKFDLTTGLPLGWIGNIGTSPTAGDSTCAGSTVGTFTPGWCQGGAAAAGTGDGMFSAPTSLVIRTTRLYVLDGGNFRVSRYVRAKGGFSGWIGNINTSPTGGDTGCAGASASTYTLGWCLGGTAKTGTGNGMLSAATNLFIDGISIYVADTTNHRIGRYSLLDGSYTGWIGNINTSPTAGDAGCNGATPSTFTPGWCLGGTAKTGTGNGMMASPSSVFVDGSGSLFVAEVGNHRVSQFTVSSGVYLGSLGGLLTSVTLTKDPARVPKTGSIDGTFFLTYGTFVYGNYVYVSDSNSRISRFLKSTGAFAGWIGRIGASPTGGDAGCAGAAVNGATPGWCVGGTSTNGSGDGMMDAAYGVYVDASGLYVTDTTNARLSKFDAVTGLFIGWIGRIGSSPTGGDAGCAGATAGTFTPGWCKGGSAVASGAGDGSMNNPRNIVIYGGSIYLSDHSNSRINKYAVSNGAFAGWIGKIATSPTGGDSGCAGAGVGLFTPGWCIGGTTAATGTGDGMFSTTGFIDIDASGNLYVPDTNNYRIQKFTASTGAFLGWVGRVATVPTGGASGCTAVAVNSNTPGWCTGGTSKSGTSADGALSSVEGVSVDSAGSLYVANYGGNRVDKFSAATGVFKGWLGMINASPTGGAPGCNKAATGTVTPGFCIGGTSSSSAAGGGFSGLCHAVADGAGNLYVSDFMNNRLVKMKLP